MSEFQLNAPNEFHTGKYIDPALSHEFDTPTKKESEIKREIPFWFHDPNILLDTRYVFEFFPVFTMSMNQKLNAITRLVLAISVFGFVLTKSIRLVLFSLLTCFAIVFYQLNQNQYREPYRNPTLDLLQEKGITIPSDLFDDNTPVNPFSNVLISDIELNPYKKPAPSSDVKKDIITATVKNTVNRLNPTQPNISDKLFRGLADELSFEQSLNRFVTNPTSTIPDDQLAFQNFCYGSMISSKEGNAFSAARNLSRYTDGQN